MEPQKQFDILYLQIPKQAQHIFNYTFHKMLPVQSLKFHRLDYIQILKILQNLGFVFYCEKATTKAISHMTFNIFCPDCKIKILKIQIMTNLCQIKFVTIREISNKIN